MSDTSDSSSSYIEFKEWKVWYDVYGSGSKPVLLIPGGIGTGLTDFYEQLEGSEPLDMDQLTLVAVDPPGNGRSRPPIRKYSKDSYELDAQCFQKIMQNLGYNRFSIIGWSDGARTALHMAIKYPDQVESLVLTALSSHVSEKCAKVFATFKNVDIWDKDRLDNYLRGYRSVAEVQNMWSAFTKFALYYNSYFPTDPYKDKYSQITCPVLVFHGDRDQMIDVNQPMSICKSLRKAKLYRIAAAGHDLHQKFALRFKTLTEEHILGN